MTTPSLALVLTPKWRTALTRARQDRERGRAKIVVMGIAGLAFWSLVFGLSYRVLRYFQGVEEIGTLLPTKLVIDQYYVDHQSWLLDVKCILWTAVALLRGGELQLSELADHVAFRQPRSSGGMAGVSFADVEDMSRAA